MHIFYNRIRCLTRKVQYIIINVVKKVQNSRQTKNKKTNKQKTPVASDNTDKERNKSVKERCAASIPAVSNVLLWTQGGHLVGEKQGLKASLILTQINTFRSIKTVCCFFSPKPLVRMKSTKSHNAKANQKREVFLTA